MSTPAPKTLPLFMGVPEDHVLTQAQFLLQFQTRYNLPGKSRPFCFILGAGASVQSKIPTARQLIDEWLPESTGAQVLLVAKRHGKGRVVVAGSWKLCTLDAADNRRLLDNTCTWLAGVG